MTPSSNITSTPRFSFNSSTKVLSHAAGHEQATANSAGSVTGTTHVLTSDIASSLLAGSSPFDSHSAYSSTGFVGFVDSVTDLGSTTEVVFGSSVTVSQNTVLDFVDGILFESGNPQIGTYEGSIQIVPGEATEFKKFVITCDSGFKVANFSVSLDSQGSDITNSMLSFTQDDTVDGSGNVTARTVTVFINIPVGEPILQTNNLGVHLFYSLTINPI